MSNFDDLEAQAKRDAIKLIVDSFQRYENLDKVSQLLKFYKSQEEATEAQLKLAIKNQLDNVKDGLEKLDSSFNEVSEIQKRMEEISSASIKIKGLSSGLEKLQSQTRQQQQLAAAMDNMDYLVNVPNKIEEANMLLESNNFLHAHKILQELEGIRDEIIIELTRQQSSEADIHVIDGFFREADNLNKKMLIHIRLMGERVINACVTHNKVLVNCIRIIDREERMDELWATNKEFHDYPLPNRRPKGWKDEFFSRSKLYIRQKIFESALDEEQEKGFLPRHLEAIRLLTIADLKIIKNLGIVYFPQRYRVFEEFVTMYHDIICEYVQNKAANILDDKEAFQLLGWINHYYTQEFMGSLELNIDFSQINFKYPKLLNPEEYEQLAAKYLERQRISLTSWFSNSVRSDREDWMRSEVPPLDGESCYHTELSIVVFKPLTEMIGPDKVLSHLGEPIREKFYPIFLQEFQEFQKEYRRELINYRETGPNSTPIPNRIEYLVANCNNCLRLETTLTEMINDDIKNNTSIQVKIDSTLKDVSKENFNVAQLCLDCIKEAMFTDLASVFQKVLSEEWINQKYCVVDYLLGTFVDYDNTFIYLKPLARSRLVKAIIQKMVVEYIKALLTKNVNLSADDRKRVGNLLYYEGDKIIEFFRGKMKLDQKFLESVEVVILIAKMMQNSDKSMLRLDVGSLMKRFPGIRKDQMVSLLMLRGDMKMNEAKEFAGDLVYSTSEDKNNVFAEVAAAMNRA